MKKITVSLFFIALFSLCGCVDDRPAISGSVWVYQDEVASHTLCFYDQMCQATTRTALDGGSAPLEEFKIYTYIPPKITFAMADGSQAVGIFYDDYTRLEVVNQSVEYTFTRID